MENEVTISFEDLERALHLALNAIREFNGGGGRATFSHNYFWSVSGDELFEVESVPRELTIGQVSGSIRNLDGILSGEDIPIPHHLIWIAEILKAYGHEAA